jgi:hypothetical protein
MLRSLSQRTHSFSWKRERLAAEQAIGQMPQLLREYERRLRDLARQAPSSDPGTDRDKSSPAIQTTWKAAASQVARIANPLSLPEHDRQIYLVI